MAHAIQYQPDESPPFLITCGLGLQLAALNIAAIVITPAIVVQAAGGTEAYLSWAVFCAVTVCGLMTIVQTMRIGRIGAGHVLIVGASGPFLGICVHVLADFGPAAMATLVAVSSIFVFLFAAKLAAFRRILTPAVTGTAIMLIPVTVMPVVFEQLRQIPDTQAESAGMTALVTLLVTTALALTTSGSVRLWTPLIGIGAGTIVAVYYGIYDVDRIVSAPWVGLPEFAWPGLALDLGAAFWTALPAFVLITLVGGMATIGDAVGIQRISWRDERRVDFRAVQGAVSTDGVAQLLSGVAGTMPSGTYSASVAVVELTGVASRAIGVAVGAVFLVVAFVPKATAVILAIPGSVAAAYLAVLLAMLFVLGMKVVIQGPLDYRTSLIVGVGFWLGVGIEAGAVYPQVLAQFAGGLLNNGLTTGALCAIAMSMVAGGTGPRPQRLDTEASLKALPAINQALDGFRRRSGWGEEMKTALESACEETLLTLMPEEADIESGEPRQLRLIMQKTGSGARLEFIASTKYANLSNQLALLPEEPLGHRIEQDVSLRLLQHVAASVDHRHYQDIDIVTVEIANQTPLPTARPA